MVTMKPQKFLCPFSFIARNPQEYQRYFYLHRFHTDSNTTG